MIFDFFYYAFKSEKNFTLRLLNYRYIMFKVSYLMHHFKEN